MTTQTETRARAGAPIGPALAPRLLVEPIVRAALMEDLGRAGDATSNAVIPPDAVFDAALRARAPGVAAGLDCAAIAFELVDPALRIERIRADGARVAAGETLLRIAGSARSILSGERVALNFAGRLSGVATLTRAMADAVAHTKARVADTRKTTPGLRLLEKQAVRLGGGVNHRFGLDDAILVKDNHIAVAGGAAEALRRAKAAAGHLTAIEIEVDTLAQLDAVLAEGGAHAVLLDNMPPETLAEATRRRDALGAGGPALEASGGVTLESVAAIAESGVDFISSGALTHSAPSLDLGLDAAEP